MDIVFGDGALVQKELKVPFEFSDGSLPRRDFASIETIDRWPKFVS
jgi:hypothetical protein